MAECYVTNRDVRTRYNPYFHALKIRKLEEEVREMYHLSTTVTMFDNHLGRMYISGMSVENTAISIIEKREHIEKLIEKHERYIAINEKALSKFKNTGRREEILYLYQTSVCTFDEVGEILGVTRQRIEQVMTHYKQAISDVLVADEVQDDTAPLTDLEMQELSGIIDYNATYEPKKLPRSTDPLHGIVEWQKEQNLKVKHKPKISNFR